MTLQLGPNCWAFNLFSKKQNINSWKEKKNSLKTEFQKTINFLKFSKIFMYFSLFFLKCLEFSRAFLKKKIKKAWENTKKIPELLLKFLVKFSKKFSGKELLIKFNNSKKWQWKGKTKFEPNLIKGNIKTDKNGCYVDVFRKKVFSVSRSHRSKGQSPSLARKSVFETQTELIKLKDKVKRSQIYAIFLYRAKFLRKKSMLFRMSYTV